MTNKFIIAIALIVLLDVFISLKAHAQAPAAGNAAGSTSAAASAEKQDDMSARLNSLQNSKDCIANAQTREAVDQCRKSLKLERKLKATAH